MKTVDKNGTSSMHNSDSDIFRSIEVPSCPVQKQEVNVNVYELKQCH